MSAFEMGFELGLRQVQKLVMTPRLQQALQLLQMPMMQLEALIEQEVMANPILEVTQESGAGQDERSTSEAQDSVPTQPDKVKSAEEQERNEIDWNRLFDLDQMKGGRWERERRPADERAPEIVQQTGMREYFLEELRMSSLTPMQFAIGEYLVGSLDDDGYLRSTTPEELAERLGVSLDEVETVRETLKGLEPAGIGSVDLRECLLSQLDASEERNSPAWRVVDEFLDDFMHKRFPKLASALDCTVEDVQSIAERISRLDPKPGVRYSTEDPGYIIPDLIVDKIEGEYVVYANDRYLPRLRISPVYQGILAQRGDSEAKTYLGERLNAARWLIKTIEQRRRTMIKVMSHIVDIQREFFEKGERYLKPLTLQDVADAVGMHESTISRVTSGKYAQTPRGVYELKYFFGGGLQKRGGEPVSVRAVRRIIKELIEDEDPDDPLSDERIASELKRRGYKIARRTVSKYREQMNTLPARLRLYKMV